VVADEHRAGRPKPTISDVARRAGVSKGLVSFVFNDRPGVATATRERILAAAGELGWRPSVRAKSLSTQTSFALGLVIRREPHVIAADPFFPGFVAGVESALTAAGLVLVLSVVPDHETEVRTYRSLVADNRVDGVFLTDLQREDPRIALLQQLGLPAVTVGHPDAAAAFPSVNLDDSLGITEAVQHLVSLGHRAIAHVSGDPLMLHSVRRADSFSRAMTESGLDGSLVVPTDFSAGGGAAATRDLLGRAARPTAIVYANDPMALAGLGVLHAAGVVVPADVSIVGFDGVDIGRHIFPALTTVVADPERWGAAAATTLLTLIADGTASDVELPPARLELRHSTAPPPDGPLSSTPDPPQRSRSSHGPQ
jgi:DNA-binding LacI/PurR family transcriptional regulator